MSRLDRPASRRNPILGLAEPVPSVPVGAADESTRERAASAYAAAGVEPPAALAAAAEPEEPVERKEKIGGWYGYPSNLARIRAAQHYTQTQPDGWPSLSEMTEQLLLAEAERLEKEHNGGEPFPAVPAGKVRHSRRT